MAGIGLRKPYFAIYQNVDSVVTYSKGGLLGKAIEFSASVEDGSNNNLYADDGVAESDRTFAGGTISLTTDDLFNEVSATILGVVPKELTVGDTTVKELIFDDTAVTPYLGIGIVVPKMNKQIISYRAIVFPKVMFSVPEDAATTKGESIEWQTKTIEGTILRSDATGHPWKRETTVADEETAIAYIKQLLNITDVTPTGKEILK